VVVAAETIFLKPPSSA